MPGFVINKSVPKFVILPFSAKKILILTPSSQTIMFSARSFSRNAIFRLPAHCRSALFLYKPINAEQLPSIQLRKTLTSLHRPIINQSQPTYITSTILKRHTTNHLSKTSVDEEKHPIAIYKTPTTGFLSLLPSPLVPYAELARLDKPIGSIYLFLPCVFSTLLAAPLAYPVSPCGPFSLCQIKINLSYLFQTIATSTNSIY